MHSVKFCFFVCCMILETLAYGSVKRISRAVLKQRKNYSCYIISMIDINN